MDTTYTDNTTNTYTDVAQGFNTASQMLIGALATYMARKEAERARKKMAMQEAEQRNLFNKQYYQDILNRPDTQNMLRRLRNDMELGINRVNNAAAVTGQTSEAKAAAKADFAKSYADAVANIAASAADNKDAALTQYQNSRNQSYNNWVNLYNGNAQNWSKFASQAFQMGADSLNYLLQ